MYIIHVNNKITLRPIEYEHKNRLQLLANEEVMSKNVGDSMPYPYTLTDAERWISHCKSIQWSEVEWQYGIFIDWIYAWNIWRECKGLGRKKYNYYIWYRLWKEYRWQGLMSEIVLTFSDHIFSTLPCHRCYTEVFERNKWSCRVLEKSWFICEWILKDSLYYEWSRYNELLYSKINTNSITIL